MPAPSACLNHTAATHLGKDTHGNKKKRHGTTYSDYKKKLPRNGKIYRQFAGAVAKLKPGFRNKMDESSLALNFQLIRHKYTDLQA
jgi:hypothetical protein